MLNVSKLNTKTGHLIYFSKLHIVYVLIIIIYFTFNNNKEKKKIKLENYLIIGSIFEKINLL